MPYGREEADFQKAIRKLVVKDIGALYFHDYDSRRNDEGFPDTVIVRGNTLIFSELKSMKGKPRDKQIEWLNALQGVRHMEVGLWRPDQLDDISNYLAMVGYNQSKRIPMPGTWNIQ